MCSRRRKAAAIAIALALGVVLVLAVSLATGTELSRGVEAAAQCGPDTQQRSQAEVTLDPSSGLAGASFNVAVAGMKQYDTGVEIYWDSIGEDNLLHSGSKSGGPTTYNTDVQAPDDATITQHWVIVCAGAPDLGWWWQRAVFEVIAPPESPTPTPTPTATPTPTETPTPTLDQMYNCPQAGKWAIVVWQGADGVAADEALATCGEGAVDAAYALDASNGEWLRWFAGRPEVSELSMVENMQGLIALGSPTAGPSPTAKLVPPEPGRMRGCPLPGRWALAVWEGPDASDAGAALDTCGVWQADVAYSLDPMTGGWARWFRAEQEFSTFGMVPGLEALFVWGGGQTSDLIAFTSLRDGNAEIYVMKPDGSGQTRLTYDSHSDSSSAWSPDRSKIAFHTYRFNNEVYVMNANGSLPANLTNYAYDDFQPAWSPDGTKIAFVSDRDDPSRNIGSQEIYVMNANGTGPTQLTNNWDMDTDPAWSPDGTKIAFTSGRDLNYEIYVMNADGTVEGNATLNGANDEEPAWSPDGTKIAFTSDRNGDRDIYVMNADGTGQTRLTFYSTRDDAAPSWSPDGTKIAFEAAWAGENADIWVMNADGTGQTILTTDDARDGVPAWSSW